MSYHNSRTEELYHVPTLITETFGSDISQKLDIHFCQGKTEDFINTLVDYFQSQSNTSFDNTNLYQCFEMLKSHLKNINHKYNDTGANNIVEKIKSQIINIFTTGSVQTNTQNIENGHKSIINIVHNLENYFFMKKDEKSSGIQVQDKILLLKYHG